MDVIGGRDWSGWYQVVDGDGALSIADGVATCSSGAGTGRARLSRRVWLSPGERVDVSIMARRTAGVDATAGGMWFDWPAEGTAVDSVRIISAHWCEYRLTYIAPPTATATQYLTISIGQITSSGGTVLVHSPRIDITASSIGAPRVLACGMIKMAAGVPTLVAEYQRCGISLLAYASNTLSLTLPAGVPFYGRPLAFVQQLADTGTNALRLEPKVAGYDPATGILTIRWIDVTTGAVADAASYGTFRTQLMVVM